MHKIEIPLSKTKILLAMLGSILFVVLGCYLVTTGNQQTKLNPILAIGVLMSIVFFGMTGIYAIKKLFDKNPGLIIDENGIIDNTNASSIGLIKWSEITAIKTTRVMLAKFLLIFTNDPNEFLAKTSGIKRNLMVANMKIYGTPLSITSGTLKYNFNDLEKLLTDRLKEQQQIANR